MQRCDSSNITTLTDELRVLRQAFHANIVLIEGALMQAGLRACEFASFLACELASLRACELAVTSRTLLPPSANRCELLVDVGGDAALLDDATRALRKGLVGIRVVGTFVEQYVTTLDQGECLRSVLAWVPRWR